MNNFKSGSVLHIEEAIPCRCAGVQRTETRKLSTSINIGGDWRKLCTKCACNQIAVHLFEHSIESPYIQSLRLNMSVLRRESRIKTNEGDAGRVKEITSKNPLDDWV